MRWNLSTLVNPSGKRLDPFPTVDRYNEAQISGEENAESRRAFTEFANRYSSPRGPYNSIRVLQIAHLFITVNTVERNK